MSNIAVSENGPENAEGNEVEIRVIEVESEQRSTENYWLFILTCCLLVIFWLVCCILVSFCIYVCVVSGT